MVNALSRRLPTQAIMEDTEFISISVSNNSLLPTDEKFPCALREFVNSNSDLPTIEELAKKSKVLALAMGMLL